MGNLQHTCKRGAINNNRGKTATSEDLYQTNQIYVATSETTDPTSNIYMGMGGRFPIMHIKGHRYIMVLYEYERNGIYKDPIKSRGYA